MCRIVWTWRCSKAVSSFDIWICTAINWFQHQNLHLFRGEAIGQNHFHQHDCFLIVFCSLSFISPGLSKIMQCLDSCMWSFMCKYREAIIKKTFCFMKTFHKQGLGGHPVFSSEGDYPRAPTFWKHTGSQKQLWTLMPWWLWWLWLLLWLRSLGSHGM